MSHGVSSARQLASARINIIAVSWRNRHGDQPWHQLGVMGSWPSAAFSGSQRPHRRQPGNIILPAAAALRPQPAHHPSWPGNIAPHFGYRIRLGGMPYLPSVSRLAYLAA